MFQPTTRLQKNANYIHWINTDSYLKSPLPIEQMHGDNEQMLPQKKIPSRKFPKRRWLEQETIDATAHISCFFFLFKSSQKNMIYQVI